MKELTKKLREFAAERDWEQFHSPKNLSMALSAEVAEIVEIFQWLTEEESYKLNTDKLEKVKEEIGDVVIYLAMIADKLGINPIEAAWVKISINEVKYPVDKSKGNPMKYNEI